MKGQKKALNLYVSTRVREAAQGVAETTGTNVSALVEAAITEYLAAHYGITVEPSAQEIEAELKRRGLKVRKKN